MLHCTMHPEDTTPRSSEEQCKDDNPTCSQGAVGWTKPEEALEKVEFELDSATDEASELAPAARPQCKIVGCELVAHHWGWCCDLCRHTMKDRKVDGRIHGFQCTNGPLWASDEASGSGEPAPKRACTNLSQTTSATITTRTTTTTTTQTYHHGNKHFSKIVEKATTISKKE